MADAGKDKLAQAAIEAMAAAYAPYSQFQVGAAIEDDRGQIHTGVNVENAAYPVGSCAEAGAIAAMVRAGGKNYANSGCWARCGVMYPLRRMSATDT